MRLVVHEFKVASDVQVGLDKRFPLNLFRDDTVRTTINSFIFANQAMKVSKNLEPQSFPKTNKVSVKKSADIF